MKATMRKKAKAKTYCAGCGDEMSKQQTDAFDAGWETGFETGFEEGEGHALNHRNAKKSKV